MLLVYIYVALASYNTGYLTLPFSSIETIIDDAANVATIDSRGKMGDGGQKGKDKRDRMERVEVNRDRGAPPSSVRDWKTIWSQGTDAVMDVPLGGVCEVLYGEFREDDEEDES